MISIPTCSSGEITSTVVMAEVVLFHVLEEVTAKSPSGKTIVDINKYRPMARLGGNFYGVVSQVSAIFEVKRLAINLISWRF